MQKIEMKYYDLFSNNFSMVFSRDIRCGCLNIEVNANWIHSAIAELGYEDSEDEEWDWKFQRYCEDMELEIYREHSGRDYCFFNWTEWFADNYHLCEYFEDLFISDNSE